MCIFVTKTQTVSYFFFTVYPTYINNTCDRQEKYTLKTVGLKKSQEGLFLFD